MKWPDNEGQGDKLYTTDTGLKLGYKAFHTG